MKSIICTTWITLTLVLTWAFTARTSEAAPTGAASPRVSMLSTDEWQLVWVGVDAQGNDLYELRPSATAADLASVVVSPDTVIGGETATGTVTLSRAADAGGAVVALASDDPSTAAVPASVTVPSGATTATFTVTTQAVAAIATATISASFSGVNRSSGLTVMPAPPAAPTNLVVSSPGQTQLGLVWTDHSSTETGFEIERMAPGEEFARIASAGANATSFTDTGLFPNTFYIYRVRAVNSAGASAYSNEAGRATVSILLAGIAVNPSAVRGGRTATGSVSLNGTAPAGGAVVSLSSANPAVVAVPASVTVPAGASSATFTATTSPVGADTSVDIAASYGGGTQSAPLTVQPPVLAAVAVSPTRVIGGSAATGTATLSDPAPAGGAVVTLGSSSSAASVPGSVTVPAGATSATFSVATSVVAAETDVTLTGDLGGQHAATLTVAPPIPPEVPSSLAAGALSQTQIGLSWGDGGPNETGFEIERQSGGAGFSRIATVGANVTAFTDSGLTPGTLYTYRVRAINSGGVSAYSGEAGATTLPLLIASVALDPVSLRGGHASTGTVTLNGAAPAGGAVVSLVSDNAAATVPASVTVAAGATSATFGVATTPAGAATTATISASYAGSTQSATLAVQPPGLVSLTLNPARLVGGNPATGTITLSDPAPAGGAVVTLSSSSPVAGVPGSVTVAAGATTATFSVTTQAVTSEVAATIGAAYAGASQSATLAVTPPPVPAAPSNLAVTPRSQTELTLSWADNSANETGFQVERRSGASAFAPIATAPAGATQFVDSGLAPGTSYTYRVRAVNGGGSSDYSNEASGTTPAIMVTALTLSPSTLTGGGAVTGTVTLNSPAPAGGAAVTLSSDNAVATAPGSVTVAAGATTATFAITTQAVTATTTVGITASYGGGNAARTLTLTPPDPPDAPSGLLAHVDSPLQITLSWTDASTAEGGFEIERKSGESVFERIATVEANATTYVDAGLAPSTGYTYRVRAVNDSGASVYTDEASATTSALLVTALTLAPDAVTGGDASTGTITLNAAAPEGGVVVALASAGPALAGIPASVTVAAGAATATFPVTTQPVTAATTVDLSATFGEGTQTATLTVLAPQPPAAPASLTATAVSRTRITLAWRDSSATESGFEIERKTEGGAFSLVATVGPNVTTLIDDGLASGTTYVYRVRASSSAGPSGYSNEASARTTGLLVIGIMLEADTVRGGHDTHISVLLNGGAPAGGATVTLASDNAVVCAVPASVTVPAGANIATVVATTRGVTTATAIGLSASLSGESRSATLTVLPPAVTAVTLDPAQVVGGEGATGTVTLSDPAPVGGVAVTLSSSSAAAAVSGSVTVAAGATTASFPVTTSTVSASTSVTLAAALDATTQSATLTLLPVDQPEPPAPPVQRIAVFRPSTREWFLRAADGAATVVQWGGPDDQPVAADYLGLGQSQIAVFRPTTREWFIRGADGSTVPVQFGGPGDVPVPGDYFGLGRAQIAVFRPTTQEWFIRQDDGEAVHAQFGGPGDQPVPADYFGLRRIQIAVYRPDSGEWFLRTDAGDSVPIQWGGPGDRPMCADYFGLRRCSIAIFRPSTREWFLRRDDGSPTVIAHGGPDDAPVPADYLGLGHTQIAVFRLTTGEWFIRNDEGVTVPVAWGTLGDQPVASGFSFPLGMLSVGAR